MADDAGFGIADILGLLGGLFGTYENIAQTTQYNDAVRRAMAKEQEIYKQYAKTTPADELNGIMKLKQGMSAQMRNAIIQEVTAQMGARGLAGSPALVEQAVATALVNAEIPMWQTASQAYYQGRQLPLQALAGQRTLPLAPGKGGNPFAALVNLATNKRLLTSLFGGDKIPSTVPFSSQPDTATFGAPGSEPGVSFDFSPADISPQTSVGDQGL
jgi:hypothetical protein